MEERERGEGRQEKKEASALISFLEQVRNKCYHVWGGNGLQRVGVDWTGTMKSWDKEGGACQQVETRQNQAKWSSIQKRKSRAKHQIHSNMYMVALGKCLKGMSKKNNKQQAR